MSEKTPHIYSVHTVHVQTADSIFRMLASAGFQSGEFHLESALLVAQNFPISREAVDYLLTRYAEKMESSRFATIDFDILRFFPFSPSPQVLERILILAGRRGERWLFGYTLKAIGRKPTELEFDRLVDAHCDLVTDLSDEVVRSLAVMAREYFSEKKALLINAKLVEFRKKRYRLAALV